ncbi:D-amino-acid dehydrogenase [Burkholderiales bacterium]|nr:D-amino-acid dehydrogenase [Burkholderiales bacterium]
MRVAVLGAGVVGLSAAYWLARDGHETVVVDRNDGVALETSYANGAQLSYSYVAPLAGPGVLPKIPPWLLRRDSPLRFRPTLDPDQWRWLLRFVLACNRERSEATTRRLLVLSFYSRRLMHEFVARESIEFGHAVNGKLVVHSDEAGYGRARALVDYQRTLGCDQDGLDRPRCLALEPAFGDGTRGLGARLVGAIHTPGEEVGDCYRFCVELERLLMAPKAGVRFALGTQVQRLVVERNRVVAVESSAGPIDADAFVVAAGAASGRLVSSTGLRLPVYPLKGYSITLPVCGASPRISVTDFRRKVVYAPLAAGDGPRLRVAGMADLAGWSREPDPVRLGQLVGEARAAFPDAADYDAPIERMAPWCGLRPATPLGTPILGASPFANLFLDVGHGALGWTLALASGRIVADAVARRRPDIPLDGFAFGA